MNVLWEISCYWNLDIFATEYTDAKKFLIIWIKIVRFKDTESFRFDKS